MSLSLTKKKEGTFQVAEAKAIPTMALSILSNVFSRFILALNKDKGSNDSFIYGKVIRFSKELVRFSYDITSYSISLDQIAKDLVDYLKKEYAQEIEADYDDDNRVVYLYLKVKYICKLWNKLFKNKVLDVYNDNRRSIFSFNIRYYKSLASMKGEQHKILIGSFKSDPMTVEERTLINEVIKGIRQAYYKKSEFKTYLEDTLYNKVYIAKRKGKYIIYAGLLELCFLDGKIKNALTLIKYIKSIYGSIPVSLSKVVIDGANVCILQYECTKAELEALLTFIKLTH